MTVYLLLAEEEIHELRSLQIKVIVMQPRLPQDTFAFQNRAFHHLALDPVLPSAQAGI